MLNHPALDLVFAALADPSRRTMVERLSRGPASVSDLAQPLDMSLPAVMQHLQVLETSWERRFDRLEAFLAEQDAEDAKAARSIGTTKPRRRS
jgi:DNA-binding transcriptional ArsR family regulator